MYKEILKWSPENINAVIIMYLGSCSDEKKKETIRLLQETMK